MGSPPLGLPTGVARRIKNQVPGAGARTDRRSLETMVPTPQEAARAIGARRHRVPGMQGRRHKYGDVPSRASERCAITSRTNRHSPERNQRGETRTVPSALQRRRQEALGRSLAGDPIAVICRERGCAKSWLSQWQHRSQVPSPRGFRSTLDVLRPPRRQHLMPSKRTSSGCAIHCRQTGQGRSALA